MHVEIESSSYRRALRVHLSDERRELVKLLSILSPDLISGLTISDFTESRLPKNLASLTSLESLKFVRCHALSGYQPELGRCAALKKLSFADCADFNDLCGISACKKLVMLQITGCDSFESPVAELSEMSELRAIDFSYCRNLGYIDASYLPESVLILDIHGCECASFDEEKMRQLPLLSAQIQDLSRLESGFELSKPDDIAHLLRLAVESRDSAGLDD